MPRKHSTSWRPLQVHYRRRQSTFGTGAIVLTAGVVAALVIGIWQSPKLPALLPTAAPRETVTVTASPTPTDPSTSPAPTAPVPTPTTSQPEPSEPQPEEGHDYSFMNTVDGEPVAWGCTAPIRVATADDVPVGTQEALTNVVEMLRDASNLPLQTVAHGAPADITVHYVAPGTTRGHITLKGGTTLGQAGPRSVNGHITSGIALIRNDHPATNPATPGGQAVLMHELAHTLGLSHAHQSTDELMTPLLEDGGEPALGPGDTAGLQILGCP